MQNKHKTNSWENILSLRGTRDAPTYTRTSLCSYRTISSGELRGCSQKTGELNHTAYKSCAEQEITY